MSQSFSRLSVQTELCADIQMLTSQHQFPEPRPFGAVRSSLPGGNPAGVAAGAGAGSWTCRAWVM